MRIPTGKSTFGTPFRRVGPVEVEGGPCLEYSRSNRVSSASSSCFLIRFAFAPSSSRRRGRPGSMCRCGTGRSRRGTSLATTEGACRGVLFSFFFKATTSPSLRLVFLPPQHRESSTKRSALARCSSSISCSSPPAGFLSSSSVSSEPPAQIEIESNRSRRERDDERKALFFFVIRVVVYFLRGYISTTKMIGGEALSTAFFDRTAIPDERHFKVSSSLSHQAGVVVGAALLFYLIEQLSSPRSLRALCQSIIITPRAAVVEPGELVLVAGATGGVGPARYRQTARGGREKAEASWNKNKSLFFLFSLFFPLNLCLINFYRLNQNSKSQKRNQRGYRVRAMTRSKNSASRVFGGDPGQAPRRPRARRGRRQRPPRALPPRFLSRQRERQSCGGRLLHGHHRVPLQALAGRQRTKANGRGRHAQPGGGGEERGRGGSSGLCWSRRRACWCVNFFSILRLFGFFLALCSQARGKQTLESDFPP